MAKTRSPGADYFDPTNNLIFVCSHWWEPDNPDYFHAITAWQWMYYNPLSAIIHLDNLLQLPGQPIPDPSHGTPDYDVIYKVQIDACNHFLRNPLFLGDICPECNQTFDRPQAVRYNIYRGQNRLPQPKACIWDGSWPPVWTPDITELSYAY
jgi:hypothetical protein